MKYPRAANNRQTDKELDHNACIGNTLFFGLLQARKKTLI